MSGEQNLGEQALDKVAEVAITSQLDQADQIDVDIQTDPLKLVQGKLDSVAISGEGLTMKQDLRVESLGVSTDSVAVNPLKAMVGQIELTESTNAQVQVLLTEADLNRALNSDFLRQKMQSLEVTVEGESLAITLEDTKLQLPEDGKMVIDTALNSPSFDQAKQLSAVVKPFLADGGQRIGLEIISAEVPELSVEVVTALLEKIVELLDLRNFDMDGFAMQLKDFDLQTGKVLLRGNATVEQALFEQF
ncbi:DUF2993 domain-containing protein [Leptolyngbya sp. 7M]|uniref:LmeA family phospholipid-binding protein n=1 Tax=Leptolyngbya sp. 7M TaxID=2812896 RepID=UPI001B8C719A|nr:DUF2993 domain-containing protein [Leptolyngbya sp. 7M]QYO61993.1 DUF2993 domain-containing protein [Leptolyngbya sp. 7M]